METGTRERRTLRLPSAIMKLGVYGGTFDPIHNGHLAVARAAMVAHGLDRVVLVPAARPPHKRRSLASGEDRLAMARLGVEGEDWLEVSDLEIRRGGISYTVDSLEAFSRANPGAELYFIVGADSVSELTSWKNLRGILERARIVTVNRPGHEASFRAEDFRDVPAGLVERCERDRVVMAPCSTSSTDVRLARLDGRPLAGLVPPPVERYIEERGLYR